MERKTGSPEPPPARGCSHTVCLGLRSSESADALPAAGLCAQCGRALLWVAGMGPSAPCLGHLLVPPAPRRAGAWPGDRELPLWSSAFWELLRCGAQTARLSPDGQRQAWELSAESDAQGLWAPGGRGEGCAPQGSFLERLMPERSLEGRGGSATPSVDEEHRKGQLGRKEQQVRGHWAAGKGGALGKRKAFGMLGIAVLREKERSRQGPRVAGTRRLQRAGPALPSHRITGR